jgi:hypothetical protein
VFVRRPRNELERFVLMFARRLNREDHAQSQCDPSGVTLTGENANPTSLPIFDTFGSLTTPAADVASTHIATLPCVKFVSHSVKPADVAPGSP